MHAVPETVDRSAMLAMWRGTLHRCPNCGRGGSIRATSMSPTAVLSAAWNCTIIALMVLRPTSQFTLLDTLFFLAFWPSNRPTHQQHGSMQQFETEPRLS